MSRGKDICKELKAVRRRIAEENDIPLEIKECTYHGPCRGTCPRCEAEVRYLERELEKRIRLGKVATVAGVALSLASCGSSTSNGNATDEVVYTGEPLPPVVETDTAKHIADTAKPMWREPDKSILDIVVGDVEVIDLDDTLPDSYADIEEGEASVEPLFGVTEVDPEFPGGLEALNKYITYNLKYPQLALENAIQGKVFISFFVEKDGSISNVHVLRDIGGGCGLEAERVVKSMPKWIPGKQSGKPVRTQFNLPVNFVLPEDRPRIIEGGAIYQGMPIQDVDYDVSPNAPTQQMEVEGVKLIVR